MKIDQSNLMLIGVPDALISKETDEHLNSIGHPFLWEYHQIIQLKLKLFFVKELRIANDFNEILKK